MSAPHVLLIDNHDSFVFNLAESFERLGARVAVYRNTIEASQALQIAEREHSLIVLSPGPGRPEDAGCCLSLIEQSKGKVPVLGVCLGHQAIFQQAGAEVVAADSIVHGKASLVEHDGRGMLQGLPSPFAVARYHSLCVREAPERFTVHARLGNMIMAASDEQALQMSVQFHPESILTPAGDGILVNALRCTQ